MAPKFTLRMLFIVVAICAVCALLVRTSDWIATVGFGLSALIVIVAINFTPAFLGTRWNRGIRYLALLAAGVIAWFSIVDYSRSYDWCAQCSDHRFIDELRICGIPAWSMHGDLHIDNVSRLRTDLGMPCEHRFEREHLVRVWGLVCCARPCIGITCCLSGDPDYYDDHVSLHARQFAAENADDAIKLCKLVVETQDYDAMHAFIAKMKERETKRDDHSRFNAPEQNGERESSALSGSKSKSTPRTTLP